MENKVIHLLVYDFFALCLSAVTSCSQYKQTVHNVNKYEMYIMLTDYNMITICILC